MKRTLLAAAAAILAGGLFAWAQDSMPPLFKVFTPAETVLLRGTATLSNRSATIALPAWFEGAAHSEGRTVQLTCKDGFSPLSVGSVTSGQFTVTTTEAGNASQAFHWEVKANTK